MSTVTIRDVAAAAGVSIATASRVLSGHPSTSERSRAQVQRVAQDLGFRPNAQAQSLRRSHSDTIGILLPDIRNPFFAEIAHNAEQRALALGMATLLCNGNESTSQQDLYLDRLLSQRVDGIIVAPTGDGSGALREVLDSETPMVFVDRTVAGLAVPAITSDSYGGIHQAVEHLAVLGHRRVGYIAGPEATSTGRERLAAFEESRRSLGLDLDPNLVRHGDFQEESGRLAAVALLALGDRPTALIAADSLMTVGALQAIREAVVAVPEDISLIGYDDVAPYRLLTPALTTIAHDPALMGRLAVDLLAQAGRGEPVASRVLDSQLIVRESTGLITMPGTRSTPSAESQHSTGGAA